MLDRLKEVELGLGLKTDEVLAQYLRVGVDELRRFKANPQMYPLPAAGAKSLGVAWRYLAVSNAILSVLPSGLGERLRRWECSRALVLAGQRAGQKGSKGKPR